jgi:hypothetical protein
MMHHLSENDDREINYEYVKDIFLELIIMCDIFTVVFAMG